MKCPTGLKEPGVARALGFSTVACLAIVAVSVLTASAIAAASAPAPGKVIQKGQYASSKGPWLVYNRSKCSFKTTKSHPKTYVANLRSQPGLRLAYTPEGTQFEFDKILNAATKAAAVKAKMKFFQFTNEYPSKTLPIDAANQAVTVKANVVISGNVFPDLYPRIQEIYKKACIPWLNEFALEGTKGIPKFQGDNYDTGRRLAVAAAAIIRQRGWPKEQIRIVSCSDLNVARTRESIYGIVVGYRESLTKLLGLPSSAIQQPDIVCKAELGPEGARQAMTDWLTAHPDAKYVTAAAWADDPYSIGLADGLRQRGFGERALVVGRGGSAQPKKLIAAGDPIMAATADPRFPGWGPLIVSMAQDIALGKPVPLLASPPAVVVTKANIAQYP